MVGSLASSRRCIAAAVTLAVGAGLAVLPAPAQAATHGGGFPGIYVMLGDSYAAGEGVDPAGDGGYYPDSDSEINQCHRSSLAFGPLVAQQLTANGVIGEGQWIFTACRGDHIQNVTGHSGEDHSENPASQLSYLTSDTKTVTLQVGGNDIEFGEMAKKCTRAVNDLGDYFYPAGSAEECAAAMTKATGLIGGRRADADSALRDELVVLYRQILEAAPNAHLTVATYPRLLPTLGEYTPRKAGGVDYCVTAEGGPFVFAGFDTDTATRLAAVELRLNNKIAQAVNQLRDQGLNGRIHTVRLDTHPDLTDHTLSCEDPTRPEPYVEGVLYAASTSTYGISGASFHPNEAGQAAFAQAIYDQAANVGNTALIVPRPTGSTMLRVGGTSHVSFRARNGNPTWVPIITNPDAIPNYQIAVSLQPTLGITLAGEPAVLTVNAGPDVGRFRFDVTATDARGTTATRRTWIDVVAHMSITTETLPVGSMNAPYEALLEVDAALGPLTWAAEGLPAGLGIDPTTGVISGTPTAESTSTVTVTADDTTSVSQKTFTLRIGPPVGRFHFPGNQPGVSLSDDGRWFAYVRKLSTSSNEYWDVMLRSTISGEEPLRISQDSSGTVTSCVHHTDRPGISDDGRFVTFSSCHRLTSDDTNNVDDVFLYDRNAGGLTLVPGTQGRRAGPVSHDGRDVVTFNGAGLYRHDLSTGGVVRIDTAADGTAGNDVAYLDRVRLADDGQRVVFTSRATNFDAADPDSTRDLYVKDLATGTVTALTPGLSEGGQRLDTTAGSVSDDLRIVAVSAYGGDGGRRQMVLDRSTGEQLVLSRDPSNDVLVSADGQMVAYTQTNIVPAQPGIGGNPQTWYGAAYRGRITTGPLTQTEAQNLSLNADGTEPRVYGDRPWVILHGLSADGTALMWWSNWGYQILTAGAGGYFLHRVPLG